MERGTWRQLPHRHPVTWKKKKIFPTVEVCVCVWGGGLMSYAALQELLNNGGVHSQSLWKKKKSNALIFHSSLVSSPSPFGSASNVNVSHSERALARALRREILFWSLFLKGSACHKEHWLEDETGLWFPQRLHTHYLSLRQRGQSRLNNTADVSVKKPSN